MTMSSVSRRRPKPGLVFREAIIGRLRAIIGVLDTATREYAMRAKVTEQGVIVPRQMLEGVSEVQIRREGSTVLVVPVDTGDPIFDLGKRPVTDERIADASTGHDLYLYG